MTIAVGARGATDRNLPLVSCIMPTANRRRFVPHALGYFEAQDYPNKELVVLDDGDDDVADLMPDDKRVRYIRQPAGQTLGARRNACVREARGDLIMHWDDDDWMAPHRISLQVDALLREGGKISGLQRVLFYDLERRAVWLYTYHAGRQPWLLGGSLLYTRDVWERSPFADMPAGEDTQFMWSKTGEQIVVLPDLSFYVAIIHPHNSSRKHIQRPYWSRWDGDLRTIMGDDLDRYDEREPEHPETEGGAMKLNLGCCDAPLPGYINVDIVAGPGVEAADLREHWPWENDSVDHVRAWDIIEHLPDKIFTMNELWRVLRPGGTAEIAVPTTDGTGAFQDPTHVSFWNRRSFLYYEAGNPYRDRFARFYGITAKFRVIREQTEHSMDGPRLTIILEAIKP